MLRSILIGLILATIITLGVLLFIRNNKDTAIQTADPQKPGLRYVALGDSYTIGEGETEDNRFPNQLVTQLAAESVNLNLVANPSRTGYTTEDLLKREINVLKENNPDFITLLIGVNDYFRGVGADEFKQRFTSVLETIQSTSPNAKLLVITIPDYGKTPAGGQFGNPNTIELGLREYNMIISEETARHNLPVADIFSVSQQSSLAGELVADGLHPSGPQYTQWVQIITPEALKLLN